MIYRTIIIGLFTLLLTDCKSRPSYSSKYGVAFNSERMRMGISEIPRGWRIDDGGFYLKFINRNVNFSKPHRLAKTIFINAKSGSIVWEQDVFYSSKIYESLDGPLNQKIIISYFYNQPEGERWECDAFLGPDDIQSLSKLECDKLLSSWGLSRL